MTQAKDIVAAAQEILPDVLERHAALVRIPSISFPGFDPAPVHEMGEAVVALFRDAGATNAELLEVPGGYPCVFAEIAGPAGSPTVLLYAHYDVQPAPKEQGWKTDPFVPTVGANNRIYGRGTADDKSGLAIHYGTLRLLADNMPCNVKILIEGEEETISHLESFVEMNPERFACDVAVIADMGPQEVGRPALTTALRGDVACTIKVSTLSNPVHSGLFGGAAPDAMTAMIRILDRLHDSNGDTVIPGVDSGNWPGAPMDEDVYHAASAILDGVQYLGTGSLSDRIWARPSVTVLGMDLPTTAEASNVLLPEVTAKLSMRIVPGSDGDAQLDALMAFLRADPPWNCKVEVTKVKVGQPFAVDMSASTIAKAEQSLADVYDAPVESIGSGGSIPLIASIQKVAPNAAIILWGAEDTAEANIHAADESVDPGEISRMIAAQTLLLSQLGTAES